uniref:Uncharacterized protein n=1 Tax=Psilocybe cubensis TaxID=181762 RepID=A0A8H7Y7J4_PSICU
MLVHLYLSTGTALSRDPEIKSWIMYMSINVSADPFFLSLEHCTASTVMSTSSLTECIGYADTNPDIAGVGVRISFYLQAFLLVLLVDRSWEDAPITLWTFIATSFGISLAAIIQREQLSFFQALQLSNLIWLANFGIFFALATYSRHKAEASDPVHESSSHVSDFKVKYGAMVQTIFSMILTLYIWIRAPTFGNQSECSPYLKFVLFLFEVRALGAGRYIGLTMSSLLTFIYVCVAIRDIQSRRQRFELGSARKPRMEKRESHSLSAHISKMSTSSTNPNMQATYATSDGVTPTRHASSALRTPLSSAVTRRPKRRRWFYDLDPIEVLLRRNPSTSDGATQWGFGQVLALIVVTPSALSVIDAFSRHGFKRLSKRKKRGHEIHRRSIEDDIREESVLSNFSWKS